MYIESQYATFEFDLPKALESYKLFTATYPRDAQAWNNLAIVYAAIGDFEQAATDFKKTWEIAKWDNVAAENSAGTLLQLDRVTEAERYLKEALDQGGGDDGNYHTNAMEVDFLAGRADWEKQIQWAAGRPDGFILEATAASIYFFQGRMHEADRHWEQAAQRAEQQHFNDTAGGLYALKALHDALTANCNGARDAARKGMALDRSMTTIPDAGLALALCGDAGPSVKEMERLASQSPTNTVINEIYVPEIKAATALAQHHPEQVAGLLAQVTPYILVSKAPHLLGRASLELKKPQQAVTDFEPGIRNRPLAIGEGAGGPSQAPDYPLCLLGTARAQAQFDVASARNSYQKLLEIWKNADADFVPAQEARAEQAKLQ